MAAHHASTRARCALPRFHTIFPSLLRFQQPASAELPEESEKTGEACRWAARTDTRTTRVLRIVVALAVVIAAAMLLVVALASLKWRYVLDSPLMIYAGFLVAGGSVPYRDLFDMNMPGTYLVMAAMGRVFGWNDLGFRVFDLLCLASISISTFLWTRRFGNLSAFAAAVAFPLWYLNGGPIVSMQREYIALVPFAAMLAVATTDGPKPWLQVLVVGVLAGMTALIKPQFLLLSLPLLLFLLQPCTTSIDVRRRIAAFAAGAAIPIGLMFLYLLRTRSLASFLDMAVNYWPLYTHLDGRHAPISGLPRLLYMVRSTAAGLVTFYAPMAVIGLIVLERDENQRRYAWMMGGLLILAGLYPAVSGQFWGYHWIPFYYVALCAACLPARVVPSRELSIGGMAPALGAVFLLFLLSAMSLEQLSGPRKGTGGDPATADEISGFLRSRMNPGDTVQPLDWTGGAVHGMLMARAPLATRFIYDFHFYHHISSPYIHKLRSDFMGELVASNPRFIIQVLEHKPWPTGPDTTRDFPELQTFLDRHYAPAQQGATYRILQRSD